MMTKSQFLELVMASCRRLSILFLTGSLVSVFSRIKLALFVFYFPSFLLSSRGHVLSPLFLDTTVMKWLESEF
jgi:hypothetical protein